MNKSNRLGWLAVLSGILVVCICFAATGTGLTLFAVQNSRNARIEQSDPQAQTDSGPFTRAEENQPRTPVESSNANNPSGDGASGDGASGDGASGDGASGDGASGDGASGRTEQAANTTEANTTPVDPLPASVVADAQLLDTILGAELPREDLADIAVRYKGITPEQATVSCPTLATPFKVGATRTFTLTNTDDDSQFQVQTRLEVAGQHVYMWVQTAPRRARVSTSALRSAANFFDRNIYPTTRAFFGEEASPGVDCDPRVHVLHVIGVGQTVGGYFSPPDAYPRAVRSDSNEGQVFIINAAPGYNGTRPTSKAYLSTIAHEFEHMISFNQTNGKALWLEEGAAQLSERLNGYPEVGTVYNFAAAPETQLNTWSDGTPGGAVAHYGAGYLWWSYLYDRFGPQITEKLAKHQDRSIRGLMQKLTDEGVTNPDTGDAFTFEALFADFVIANYMNREAIGSDTRYSYKDTLVPPMAVRNELGSRDYPFAVNDSVPQFATHYYALSGDAPVTINFKGESAVRLLPTDGDAGAFWWSNRADQSNPRLTREIDLTGVNAATLTFRAWYRLEEDYDYAYVSASEDGGKTWKTLQTSTCTTANKQNANLGCGFNGASGRSSQPQWVDEEVSLDAYAGKKILVRFEMVTDAGVNREGLAIDNIAIPELGYSDDAESDEGWAAEGWVRAKNALPQTWAVQVIVTRQDGTRVLERVTLNDGAGSLTLEFGGDVRSAVLAISPTTQVTTEPGNYSLQFR
jgi:hypothetical protein